MQATINAPITASQKYFTWGIWPPRQPILKLKLYSKKASDANAAAILSLGFITGLLPKIKIDTTSDLTDGKRAH
jgi:hypothetical protein